VTEYYLISKEDMHQWMEKRCLPELSTEMRVDLSHARTILREELEEMDALARLKTTVSKAWANACDEVGQSLDKLRQALKEDDGNPSPG
jgi:hypothetical protein